jgi:hypothetical protein
LNQIEDCDDESNKNTNSQLIITGEILMKKPLTIAICFVIASMFTLEGYAAKEKFERTKPHVNVSSSTSSDNDNTDVGRLALPTKSNESSD